MMLENKAVDHKQPQEGNEKLKLDYSLKTAEERNELVKKIIEQTPLELLTNKFLETLSDYICYAIDKEEKRKKSINTPNRMVTVNRRETSFEGICSKLENGENGIYNMISDLGISQRLVPKDPLTDKDFEDIPALQDLEDAIDEMEVSYQKSTGKKKYLLKKHIIEMRQNQYSIRNDRRGRWKRNKASKLMIQAFTTTKFYDDIYFDSNNEPVNNGLVSFFNPKHIEALLCNYSGLKEAAAGRFECDLWYLMEDLDRLIEKTLRDKHPIYYDLLIYKIDGRTNLEIQEELEIDYKVRHSVEYISSLWRKKIPRLLAEQAKEDFLIWHYTFKEKGKWKKCSRCGQIKLAHNRFFSKNKTSKDGFYSLCKDCRNLKSKQKREEEKINGGE